MLSDEELKKYGIKSASMIAEATWKPRVIITHLDDSEYIYDVNDIISIELLTNIINKHINSVCIIQIRKKKLELINDIR